MYGILLAFLKKIKPPETDLMSEFIINFTGEEFKIYWGGFRDWLLAFKIDTREFESILGLETTIVEEEGLETIEVNLTSVLSLCFSKKLPKPAKYILNLDTFNACKCIPVYCWLTKIISLKDLNKLRRIYSRNCPQSSEFKESLNSAITDFKVLEWLNCGGEEGEDMVVDYLIKKGRLISGINFENVGGRVLRVCICLANFEEIVFIMGREGLENILKSNLDNSKTFEEAVECLECLIRLKLSGSNISNLDSTFESVRNNVYSDDNFFSADLLKSVEYTKTTLTGLFKLKYFNISVNTITRYLILYSLHKSPAELFENLMTNFNSKDNVINGITISSNFEVFWEVVGVLFKEGRWKEWGWWRRLIDGLKEVGEIGGGREEERVR